ncbi:MAG: hypothetical protein H0U43_02975 [Chthoniobacterales bacterium]|nr:hypothetical protein [Chthoniobacterales bacterium]
MIAVTFESWPAPGKMQTYLDKPRISGRAEQQKAGAPLRHNCLRLSINAGSIIQSRRGDVNDHDSTRSKQAGPAGCIDGKWLITSKNYHIECDGHPENA